MAQRQQAQPQQQPLSPSEFMAKRAQQQREKPGALKQIGTSLWNAAAGTAKMGLAASPLGVLPINDMDNPNSFGSSPIEGVMKDAYEGQAEQGRKAVDEYKKGNYGHALMRGAAAITPLAGPFVANEIEKAPEHPWEVATDLALIAATKGVESGAEALATRSAARAAGDSIGNMVRGVKPRAAIVDFKQALERAMPDMKSAEADLGRPISGVRDAIDAADIGLDKNWGQFEQYLNQAAKMGAQVDGSAIAKARIASIPSKLKLENPKAYQSLVDTAMQYSRPLSVQEAQQLLAETNAAVKSYYLKYPGERYAERASDPSTAADVATGETLRNLLYDKLDQIGGGNGVPAQLKQRYGALKQAKGELMRRQNVAERQQPLSLGQQGGNLYAAKEGLDATGKLLTGHPIQAAFDAIKGYGVRKVAGAMKDAGTSDALVKRAFEDYVPTPYGSLTGANLGQLPPPMPIQPRALLPPPPTRMPAAPNPSGPTGWQPTPGRGMSPSTGQRILPPASTHFPAAPANSYPGQGPSGSVPQVPNQNVPGPQIRIRPNWEAEGKVPPERQLAAPAPGAVSRNVLPQGLGSHPSGATDTWGRAPEMVPGASGPGGPDLSHAVQNPVPLPGVKSGRIADVLQGQTPGRAFGITTEQVANYASKNGVSMAEAERRLTQMPPPQARPVMSPPQ